ncbi:MAG: RNA methyltransferase [Methanobacteriota archaeon]
MPDYLVVLVEPQHPGNLGAVARAMLNFGFERLALVNPQCEVDDVAIARAMHAKRVLANAKTYKSLKAATKKSGFVVATSGITSENDNQYGRHPMTPRELATKLGGVKGEVALVFGREDYGLYNDEMELADAFVNIPTGDEYPIMNLSHAVAVVMYELFQPTSERVRPLTAAPVEKEKLNEFFDELLASIDYPAHRRANTRLMWRRMMGRAVPTKWEFYTLAGVLKDAAKGRGRGAKVKKARDARKKKCA